MSSWNKFASKASLFGLKEVYKKRKRQKKVKKRKELPIEVDPDAPKPIKKKYNPRRKIAPVKSVDPVGYVPEVKPKHTPGSLLEAQANPPLPKKDKL